MNSLKLKNSFLLLLTAFIWGIAFVVQDSGGDALGPFTFNCLRAFIGGIVLLPTIKILDHAGLTYMKPKTKKEKKTLQSCKVSGHNYRIHTNQYNSPEAKGRMYHGGSISSTILHFCSHGTMP